MAAEEASLTGVVGVMVVFIAAGATGFAFGGMLIGVVAAGASAALGVVVLTLRSAARTHRSLSDRDAPDLRGLSPEQAMTVLSALGSSQRAEVPAPALRSELAAELEELRAADDAEAALTRLRELDTKHPRSPAVKADLARRLIAAGDESAAAVAVTQALGAALDGGMNPMAAGVFAEFAAHRNALELEARHLEQLARVLIARGDPNGAAWCRERSKVK